MESNSIFFSLRWKLAILFVAVFLALLSVFAYMSYQNAMESFDNDRKAIQSNHFNIAETLTNDSFLVLEQFAELVSIVNNPSETSSLSRHNTVSSLDENWARWQIIWDIENIAYFDKQGALVKSWGKQLIDPKDKVRLVITDESPAHQVFCPDNCYQQAIVPVMGNAEIAGVFSVTHSFSDVIIKYRNATNSDIGVFIPSGGSSNQDGIAPNGIWNY